MGGSVESLKVLEFETWIPLQVQAVSGLIMRHINSDLCEKVVLIVNIS
jgi:hypothetical protein